MTTKTFVTVTLLLNLFSFRAFGFTLENHKWEQSVITYSFNAEMPVAARDIIRKDFEYWQTATLRGTIQFQEVDQESSNGNVQVIWSAVSLVSRGIVAYTSFTTPQGVPIVSSSIVIDSTQFDPVTLADKRAPGGFNLEGVALHEIGHVLGLGHSDAPGSIMHPTVSDIAVIWPDDAAAIATLYKLPPSEIDAFRALNDKLGITYAYPWNYPKPPKRDRAIAGTLILVSGSNYYYFDAVSGNFLGSQGKGKKYVARNN